MQGQTLSTDEPSSAEKDVSLTIFSTYASMSHAVGLPSPSLVITSSKTRCNIELHHLHKKASGFEQVAGKLSLLLRLLRVQSLPLG